MLWVYPREKRSADLAIASGNQSWHLSITKVSEMERHFNFRHNILFLIATGFIVWGRGPSLDWTDREVKDGELGTLVAVLPREKQTRTISNNVVMLSAICRWKRFI